MLKQFVPAVLFGLVFSIPSVASQTSSFSQQGKVTHELQDERFSIAHSSLPLNSKAWIVNTSTGKEVEVTVNRLIPASQNRIADVSSSVWQELGLTPNTEARIYTTLSENSQTTASSAARQQESSARISQTETSPVSQTGNQQPMINYTINNYYGIQSAPESQAVQYAPPSQADQTVPAPQAVQTAPASQIVQYAPESQVIQSAPAPQTVQYAPVSQTAQPVPEPQTVQTAPASNTYKQTAAQPAMTNDMWAQIIKPPGTSAQTQTAPVSPDVYAPPQTAKPATAYETRSVTETSTPATWTRVIIDAPPQSPRPSVTIDNGW